MKIISKVVAGTLLGLGLLVLLVHAAEQIDSRTSIEDKREAVPNMLVVGLPSTLLGSWMFWRGHRQNQRQQAQRLRYTFFQLLQENQGYVTPIRFAMATGLDGRGAKAYLDQRAREFNAEFHVTPEGSLAYYFELELNQNNALEIW